MHASGSPGRRPRLTPPIADVRRAVRDALAGLDGVGLDGEGPDAAAAAGRDGDPRSGGLVLVGLSGGADSLALAAATAFEAPRAGVRAGVVIVDHGLQAGSARVAGGAAPP